MIFSSSHSTRLLNYTPQASLVRLLTINALNAYITSWVLYLSGGSEDPRLLLPAWISIASVSPLFLSRCLNDISMSLHLSQLTSYPDTNFPLPPDPPPLGYFEGNLSLHLRFQHCKFHKHGLSPFTTAPHPRQRPACSSLHDCSSMLEICQDRCWYDWNGREGTLDRLKTNNT